MGVRIADCIGLIKGYSWYDVETEKISYAIEAMGTKYGVVKTRVANRNWTGWCKSPYITYVEEESWE